MARQRPRVSSIRSWLQYPTGGPSSVYIYIYLNSLYIYLYIYIYLNYLQDWSPFFYQLEKEDYIHYVFQTIAFLDSCMRFISSLKTLSTLRSLVGWPVDPWLKTSTCLADRVPKSWSVDFTGKNHHVRATELSANNDVHSFLRDALKDITSDVCLERCIAENDVSSFQPFGYLRVNRLHHIMLHLKDIEFTPQKKSSLSLKSWSEQVQTKNI